jgi:two-component system sensor histidine kinase/response regulator
MILIWLGKASAHLYRSDDQAVIETGVAKINYEEPQVLEDGTTLWLKNQ